MISSSPTSDPDAQALRRAALSFSRALAAEALSPVTARVEARLSAHDPASVFALDAALAAAWPTEAAAPRHEVVWATGGDGDGAAALRLSAFDAAGRVLLRRSYAAVAAGKRKGAGHG